MWSIHEVFAHPLVAYGWFSAIVVLEFVGMVVYRGVKTGDWHFMDD